LPATPGKREADESLITRPGVVMTVLLVEDSDVVRAMTREILEINGYRVLDACSPVDAIRICRSHEGEIHLLLTDVVMPGMSGRELSDRLGPMRPDMKVLYMSGYTEDVIARNGVLDPGIQFIQKPFTPASMAEKILEVLKNP
jgi:CheY-like chemotaxis protein